MASGPRMRPRIIPEAGVASAPETISVAIHEEVRHAHGDSVMGHLGAKRVGERLHAGLARCVGREHRRVRRGGEGRHRQDVAPALDHVGQAGAYRAPDAKEVHLDHALPRGGIGRPHEPPVAMPALASTTSMPPKRSTVPDTARSSASQSVTSVSNQIASGPH